MEVDAVIGRGSLLGLISNGMSFLAGLFKKKQSESVVLIDIGAASVAGAYVHYKEGETPALLYTRRLPIEIRKEEPREAAMLRALSILCENLIREGSPILVRTVGNGSVDNILVSIDAPWQETNVRTESFEKKDDFIFTKSMVAKVLEQTKDVRQKKIVVDESIIGTILNGYETSDPYGKKAHRASIVILTSLIDQRIASSVTSIVQSAYHTKRIFPITDSSLRYQALCYAFPHEHDMLILDAMEPTTSIALIRRGLFVDMTEVPAESGATGSSQWIEKVTSTFSKLAERYPLPRTIFLLAQQTKTASLQKRLSSANLGSLWLSDNPPTIVSVLASHIVSFIRQITTAAPDLPLLLMALYYQARGKRWGF
ncbi:MAG: hypothetical protein UY89_C0005G0014 [Parcubacteria group bacterium GW2011_GWA1_54_9]|nr:MAG: hypothetical protein UY89_C0005G0014 [Parcubacteria group bacterium GW2011_GWA1_54_9]